MLTADHVAESVAILIARHICGAHCLCVELKIIPEIAEAIERIGDPPLELQPST